MRVSTAVVFVFRLDPLSPMIHIQILQIDLHTFLLRIVERIWFKIKAFFTFTLDDLLMMFGEN